jgi:hypothetical protein
MTLIELIFADFSKILSAYICEKLNLGEAWLTLTWFIMLKSRAYA